MDIADSEQWRRYLALHLPLENFANDFSCGCKSNNALLRLFSKMGLHLSSDLWIHHQRLQM